MSVGVAQHSPRAVNEQSTQVGIAPLADAAELRPAAGAVLARDQTERGRAVAPAGKLAPIPEGGHEGGRSEHPDAGDGLQAPTRRRGPCLLLQPLFQSHNPFVQMNPFLLKFRYQVAPQRIQPPVGRFQDRRQAPAQGRRSPGDREAEFQQQPTDLVDDRRTLGDGPRSQPMDGLQFLLATVLIATNRIVGRVTASAIASASRKSFLFDFT